MPRRFRYQIVTCFVVVLVLQNGGGCAILAPMNTYKIPSRFYLDHLARDCGKGGKVVRSTKNYLIVELSNEALDDLMTDASYYVECSDTFDPPLTGLVASAKATIKAINQSKGL